MKYLKRRQINLEPFRYIELLRIIYLFFKKINLLQSNQNYTPLDQRKNYLTPGNKNESSRLNSLNTCIEKRKSQHILSSFHQHNRTVTKDMIWQPGRRINIGFWHLTNTPLYNTSEWITFISKTFTFHICGEKVPAVFDQNAKDQWENSLIIYLFLFVAFLSRNWITMIIYLDTKTWNFYLKYT